MPFVSVGGTRLYYRLEGSDGLPVLLLSHSIGTDHGMWEPQVSGLLSHFRVLRYDIRGHGASDAPDGDYSIEQLGRDVLALADHLAISKFAFCGLSLGGAIGQWLGVNAPNRLTGLVLANTAPQFGPRENWETRMRMVRESGMASLVDMVMGRFFSPEFLARRDPRAESVRSVMLGTNAVGYAGCCAALRDFDHTKALSKITVPTLVIAGRRDVATPWEGHGELLARGIPGASSLQLAAAHLSNIERPRSFNAALQEFLQPANDPSSGLIERGMKVRRAVLGDAHVDRAIAATNDLNREFQELITRYAWGTIWTRPGLDVRTRRLLVLAMTAALGRWEEFKLHLTTGLAEELELPDLKEVLLQTAIYAGVPAANTGFHMAADALEKKPQ